jgi:glycosyltransferase involved in cell wall biosynthesis
MISVIIPLFNKEIEIANAIQSVLDQSFNNFELLIINDGSTDRSAVIAQSFSDKRIRFIDKKNGGVSSARNRGITEAKFELVAFLDGDDWWANDFLETLFNLSNKYPDAYLWAGQYVQVNKKKEVIVLDRFPPIIEGFFVLYNYLFAVWSSSILIRKEVFSKVGNFDENLTHGEDTDMWIRIAMTFQICYTDKVVAYYNISGNPLKKSIGRVPSLNKHRLSKIDYYIGKGGEKWDDALINLKISGLRKFYIQEPFNNDVINMIRALPAIELIKIENQILKATRFTIIYKHLKWVIYQKLLHYQNWLRLYLKK